MTRKTFFSKKCSWFKFNNLELALGMALKVYTSVAKSWKLKVRKFLGLIPTFEEVAGGKLLGSIFLPPPSSIGLMGFSNFMIQVHAWMIWNSATCSHVEIATCCEDFWCSDFNMPSNWLYVINIIVSSPWRNRNFENCKLLEKHHTTFTMLHV